MRFPGSAQDSVMKSGDTSISVCVCGCARVCTHAHVCLRERQMDWLGKLSSTRLSFVVNFSPLSFKNLASWIKLWYYLHFVKKEINSKDLSHPPKILQPGGNRTQIWSQVGMFRCLLRHAVNRVNLRECPKRLALCSLWLFSTSSRLRREKALNTHVVNQQVCEAESGEDSGLRDIPNYAPSISLVFQYDF